MAALPFYGDIDLLGNALRNALLDPQSGDPGSPADGQVWYNSTANVFKIRANGVTITLGRLDQISPPTASVQMNGQTLEGLGTPVNGTDAATKDYVDAIAAGLSPKQSVRAATTTNITLSGTQTIDGISLSVDDRVLVKNQSAPAENGLYLVKAGAWVRTTDGDTWDELKGATVFVEEGTANGDYLFVCTSDQGGTLGSTAVTFSVYGAGGGLNPGAGLVQNGADMDVNVDDATIEINTDIVRVKDGGITTAKLGDAQVTLAKIQNLTQDRILGRVSAGTGVTEQLTAAQVRTLIGVPLTYATDIGDGSTTSIVVTHNLGTRDVVVEVYRATTPWDTVIVPIERTTTNSVTLQFKTGQAPSTNELRVVVRA